MNSITRLLFPLLLFLTSITTAYSQDTTAYINSDEVLARGIELHDAEEYEKALEHYQLIVPGDSNYALSLSEQALTYLTKEDYAAAIKTAELGLRLQSGYKASFYDVMGSAYDYNDEIEKALTAYKTGVEKYPYYKTLLYNYAVTLRKNGDLENAQKFFIRRLEIDPFHATSHFQLAELSALQGFRTKALLSYFMYIAINPSDRETIVTIESLLNDSVEDEGSVSPYSENGFGEVDALIRSNIATRKTFKPSVDVNYKLTRHAEVMMKKLSYDETSEDFWMQLYVPFFAGSKDKKLTQALLYTLVSGVGDETANAWNQKNTKKVEALQTHAQETILNSRLFHKTTVMDQEDNYRFWYYDDGTLNAIGNSNDEGVDIGPYIYYYTNGEVSAKGILSDDGLKTGKWIYYNPDGSTSSIDTFDQEGNLTGTSINYFASGAVNSKVPYKAGKAHGTIEVFYECGGISEEYEMVNGISEGPGKGYDTDGNLTVTYTFKANEFDGPYTLYHTSGEKQLTYPYASGALDGPYTSFYKNGQINEQGGYKEGKMDGEWKGFYEDGTHMYELTYIDGIQTGITTYYYENGVKWYTFTLNAEGEFEGDYLTYDEDGKLSSKNTYAKDLIKAYAYYSKDGKVLSEGASEETLEITAYTPDGYLLAKVIYEGGQLNGPLTYYHPNGNVYYTVSATNGLWNGDYTEYRKSGTLKLKTAYVEGDNTGWYQEYYANGQLASEAMVVKGNLEQRQTSFYGNGTKKAITYYRGGNLHGQDKIYTPTGKLFSLDEFVEGTPTTLIQYDSIGNVLDSTQIKQGTGIQRIKTAGGILRQQRAYKCGKLDGDLTFYHTEDKIDTRYATKQGSYEGKAEVYHSNGQLSSTGIFKASQLDSLWTWYDPDGTMTGTSWYKAGKRHGVDKNFYANGQLESTCNYIKGERDGACEYYAPDGTLQAIKIYNKNFGIVGYKVALPDGTMSELKKVDLQGKTTLKATYANKKKSIRQQYVKGLLDGKSTYYYPNGKVQTEVTYTNGMENGPSLLYYANSQLKREINYVNGEEEGLVKVYREDGTVRYTAEFKEGLKHGYEIWYNADGSVSQKLLFSNNVIY